MKKLLAAIAIMVGIVGLAYGGPLITGGAGGSSSSITGTALEGTLNTGYIVTGHGTNAVKDGGIPATVIATSTSLASYSQTSHDHAGVYATSDTLAAYATASSLSGYIPVISSASTDSFPLMATSGGTLKTSAYAADYWSIASHLHTGVYATASSNVATATALAADPADCPAGQYPLGITAAGSAWGCTAAGAGGGDVSLSGTLTANNLVIGVGTNSVKDGGIAVSALVGLASDNTFTGTTNTFGNADTDMVLSRGLFLGGDRTGSNDAVQIANPVQTATYATASNALYVQSVIESGSTIYAKAFTSTSTDESHIEYQNNTTYDPTSGYRTYFEGGVFKLYDGAEKTVATLDATITASSALAATPNSCGAGYYAMGITTTGSASGCTAAPASTGMGLYSSLSSGNILVAYSTNQAQDLGYQATYWSSSIHTHSTYIPNIASPVDNYFPLMNAAGSLKTSTYAATYWSASNHDHAGTYIPVITSPVSNYVPLMDASGSLSTSSYGVTYWSASNHAHTGVYATADSNVATATALAANGANCTAGYYPLGVDASGAAETCTQAVGVFATADTLASYVAAAASTNFSSSTLLASSLLGTGIIDGTSYIYTSAVSVVTVSTSSGRSAYYFTGLVTTTDTMSYTLPRAEPGLQYCFRHKAGNGGILKISTSTNVEYIDLDGALGTAGGFVSASAASGNGACIVSTGTTQWVLFPNKGTWTAGS